MNDRLFADVMFPALDVYYRLTIRVSFWFWYLINETFENILVIVAGKELTVLQLTHFIIVITSHSVVGTPHCWSKDPSEEITWHTAHRCFLQKTDLISPAVSCHAPWYLFLIYDLEYGTKHIMTYDGISPCFMFYLLFFNNRLFFLARALRRLLLLLPRSYSHSASNHYCLYSHLSVPLYWC